MAFPGQSLDGYIEATNVTAEILRERGIKRHALSAEEGLLLQTIFYWTRSKKSIYGLALSGALKRSTGTVYPALRRLETYGILVSKLEESEESVTTAQRRLYTPTEFGCEILELFNPGRS